jgi:hypothetical protein
MDARTERILRDALRVIDAGSHEAEGLLTPDAFDVKVRIQQLLREHAEDTATCRVCSDRLYVRGQAENGDPVWSPCPSCNENAAPGLNNRAA